ncbi:MAG: FKBP-type peptidyl-prolyl cis-trans isomerase [Candidatus Limimorpha sp.]
MIFSFSCSFETAVTHRNEANIEFLTYLSDNNIEQTPTESGLVFINVREGNGDCPKIGSKVAVHYTGYFLDGEKFDSSYSRNCPLVFTIGSGMVIKGLEEAVMLMKRDGQAKAVVPFYLAYGDSNFGPVPSYSNLVFDLELIDFK